MPALLGDAWRQWRADGGVLSAVAGMFVFLPALAGQMLISRTAMSPPVPPRPSASGVIDDASAAAYLAEAGAWLATTGTWLAILYVIGHFAVLTMLTLYLDDRPTVAQALIAAVRRLPVYLVTMLLVALPVALGFAMLILPGFYASARLCLAGPALVAGRAAGPIDAFRKSLALTRGNGVALTGAVMLVALTGLLVQQPLLGLDNWIAANAPNPVARIIVDLAMAGVSMLVLVGNTLIALAAWRRLGTGPSSGRA